MEEISIGRTLVRGVLKGLISIVPLLLLKTIITIDAYLLFYPEYAVLYPDIELLILSLSAIPWSLQIASSMILFEYLSIFPRLQNMKGRLSSALLFSLVFTVSSYIWVTQETALHLITLFGFSFLVWICSHYSLPSSLRNPSRVLVSIEPKQEKQVSGILLSSLSFALLLPISLMITSYALNESVALSILGEFSVFGVIAGILSGCFTYLLMRVKPSIIAQPLIQQILSIVTTIIVLSQIWTAPLINWIVLLFSLVVLSIISGPRIALISQNLNERMTPSDEQIRGFEMAELFLKLILRNFIGIVLLTIVFVFSVLFEAWLVIGYVLILSPLSHSVIVSLPVGTSTQYSPYPNLLLLGLLFIIVEIGIFSIYWRSVGDVEIAAQRYKRIEPFVAILIAVIVWISFLPVVMRSTLFTLVLLILCKSGIHRRLWIGERAEEKKFTKWYTRSSIKVSGLLALFIIISTVLIRYSAHLWLAGLVFGLGILIAVFGMSWLVIGVSFRVANGVFTAIQRNVIEPQGPVLVIDVVRNLTVTIMVLLMISPLVTHSHELLAAPVLVVIVILSIQEHHPGDWKKVLVNDMKIFRGVHSYRHRIAKVAKVIGVVAVLIIGTWSSLVIYESVVNPKSEVRVAVLDTGLNSEDPQISTHLVASKSFVLTQFGYDYNDTSTTDQLIHGFHGTKVAKMVLEMFPRASIINAKVHGKDGASTEGIAAAIYWAVEEEGANVINLSLGGPNIEKNDAVEWAWKQGVVVVTSVGNSQDRIDWGAAIESPANSPYSIAVAALQNNGSIFDFSSWGPVREGFIKPDIAALGNVFGSDYDRGTSFASPRVAGVAAALIDLCLERGFQWTPGLIKAAILKGATPLPYPEYMVGIGRVNLDESMSVILTAPIIEGVPYVAYVSPSALPMDFEHVFTGTEYKFSAQVTCSFQTDFNITQSSSSLQLVVNSSVAVNQTLLVPLTIMIPDSSTVLDESMSIYLTARGEVSSILYRINARPPVARVAIDISHSISFHDSIFMRYFKLYECLVNLDIAVTEVRDIRDFRNFTGRGFDALLIMNPWITNSTLMSPESIAEIHSFYDDGGGIFFGPAQNGRGQNVTNVNKVLNWTGISYLNNETRYYYNLNVSTEISTESLEVDSMGSWILNVSNNGTVLLSTESGNTLIVGLEGSSGRMIIAGTNSMFYTEDMIGLSCLLVNWLIR